MTQLDTSNAAQARPTLKTIALETGLAVATVSRALSDAPDIGDATKVRVREAALKLGYRPNRAGVRLRTGKTNVIALVLSAEADVMNNTAQLMYSIANTLRGTSYHMVVMPFFGDQDPLDPIRYIVETGSADGVIFNQTMPIDARVSYLTAAGLPYATHGRTDMGIEHPYFDYDSNAFGELAVRCLAQRGRRKILLIAPPMMHMYAQHTLAGSLREAAKFGCDIELSETHSDMRSDLIEAAVRARFLAPNKPDSVIVASTTGAMASISGIESCGLTLGQDFDLVTKEAIHFMHRFRRDVIVASEDVAQVGEFLAKAVIAAIEGHSVANGQRLQVPVPADFTTKLGPAF